MCRNFCYTSYTKWGESFEIEVTEMIGHGKKVKLPEKLQHSFVRHIFHLDHLGREVDSLAWDMPNKSLSCFWLGGATRKIPMTEFYKHNNTSSYLKEAGGILHNKYQMPSVSLPTYYQGLSAWFR